MPSTAMPHRGFYRLPLFLIIPYTICITLTDYLCTQLEPYQAVLVAWLLLYHTCYHLAAGSFALLDAYASTSFSRYKLPHDTKRYPLIPYAQQLPIVIRNQVQQAVVYGFLLYLVRDMANDNVRAEHNMTTMGRIASHLLGNLYVFVSYDVLFTFGHYLMHKAPGFYRWSRHGLHHSSWACSGVSAQYMSVTDFWFESTGIALAQIVFCYLPAPFTMSLMSYSAWGVLGCTNAVFVHSGWELPWVFLPSPRAHWTHHHSQMKNMGIGLVDPCLGTKATDQEIQACLGKAAKEQGKWR